MALPLYPPVTFPPGAAATKVPMNYVPRLSLAERDRRWRNTRRKMILARLDALLVLGNDAYWDMGMANMRYLFQVGSKIHGQGLFFLDAEPVVWNGVPHMQRPTNLHFSVNDWIEDIRCAGGIAPIADEIRRRGLAKSRIGIVGYSSTIQVVPTIFHGEMEALKRELPEAQFVEFGWAFEEMRLIKSEEEIGMLRRAAQVGRKVIDAMVAHSRPGNTEAKVYAEMIKTQIENGCEPNVFNLFAAGPVEHPPAELWHLLHGAEQPLIPTMRPLQKGDLVIAEWHTKYGGYLAHTEYCVYVGGKAPQRLKDIFAVSVECLEASRQALRAGNTLRAAWEAVRKPAEKAKLDFVELGFHAMGLGSPEFPTVIYRPGYGTNALNGHNIADVVLEEGMCFGNNIDLHDPAWKPDVGCMLSDFMVVRPGAAECLVGTPRELAETA